MKNSNKARRFWTMNRHHASGFTLVELIVVIAILAILAGVAVPAYSGYVTSANKQADVSLASDVAQALELAFYNQELPEGGMVVLTKEGVDTESLSDDAKAALEAVYGSVTTIPGLKYDGWSGEYDGGSFKGNETELLGKVENLTGLLGSFLATGNGGALGGAFGTYAPTERGFSENDLKDSNKMADAAVLYVAHATNNLTAAQRAELDKLNTCTNGEQMLTKLSNIYDSQFLGAAVGYAMMTGYCQANNISVGTVTQVNANNPTQAIEDVINGSFGAAIRDPDFSTKWQAYAKNSIGKDTAAFMEVMKTVTNAQGMVVGNLGKEGCYSSAELKLLIDSFASGNIVVMAEVQDGIVETTLVPAVQN